MYMKAPIYSAQGKKVGEFDLPEAVFGLPWNADLVHQTTTAMETAARTPIAHAKNRGDVRGGGRKPWQQKGTGRARHGSSRSPIWKGGGVTHGPNRERSYARKINRKAGAKALFTVLSRKFRDGEIVLVEKMAMAVPKSREAAALLVGLSKNEGLARLSSRKNAALLATAAKSSAIEKSFRNFGNVSVSEARSLNPVDALRYKFILIEAPAESIGQIESRLPVKAAKVATAKVKRTKVAAE